MTLVCILHLVDLSGGCKKIHSSAVLVPEEEPLFPIAYYEFYAKVLFRHGLEDKIKALSGIERESFTWSRC